MADQWFGDLAEADIGGTFITIGTGITISEAWKKVTAPATWGNDEMDKPVSKKTTVTIPCVDMDDHSEYLYLHNLAEAKTAVAIVLYPEGNTVGKLMWSGNAYVSVSGLDSGIDKAGTFTLTLDIKGDLTPAANLVLASQAIGSTGAGDAEAYTDLSASGGTAPYTYAITEGILPEGITMNSSGVFSGTVDAGANLGTYIFDVTVTDNAATPVVKKFRCTAIVVA